MNIKIRRGETLEISIESEDMTAETVQMIVGNVDEPVIINETASFSTVSGKRVATIKTNDTDHDLGEYSYMLTVVDSEGDINKLPDPSFCDDDCELPTLTICETLEEGE